MSQIKVGVLGASGKVGTVISEAISDDTDLDLCACIDRKNSNQHYSSLENAIENSKLDVVVDFTEASSTEKNLKVLAENGIHAVVGTSGISSKIVKSLEKIFTDSNCLIAPNFAISAVIMMRFAEIAAPFFDSSEIIEMHHDQKIDAPSGTAIETLQRMEQASDVWNDDPTKKENLKNVRGGVGASGIRVHSVRLKGGVAHQEVRLGTQGQILTIRQDSFDRSSFIPGVLLAVKTIHKYPGVTLGLDKFLGL